MVSTPCNKTYQKEVGGSYYVIREIIQELEYKSKMKPLNNYSAVSHYTHSPCCPEISSKGLILYVAEIVILLYAATVFVGAILEVMPRPTKTTMSPGQNLKPAKLS
ncbi:hypothetical protein KIW84_010742 [Lathyrus oleraceus]|uniref:AT3G52170-like helix-turn-helix domain-containing protein n=1 Tax=Pisum sativum TaxID=3888 RepID=A0A9D4YKV9_PEA|nr:hypothetical protein KIW84_010741 [Pisum sativum]KAI5441388.1 hypothetical protein KIW84_010742 [Pisum sativum]